ncbi:MAG: hypothetical protein V2J26_02025, partial [Pacificimonas sp.]|nr:hypothetical protein [Pacificimonas sp.]
MRIRVYQLVAYTCLCADNLDGAANDIVCRQHTLNAVGIGARCGDMKAGYPCDDFDAMKACEGRDDVRCQRFAERLCRTMGGGSEGQNSNPGQGTVLRHAHWFRARSFRTRPLLDGRQKAEALPMDRPDQAV